MRDDDHQLQAAVGAGHQQHPRVAQAAKRLAGADGVMACAGRGRSWEGQLSLQAVEVFKSQ